MKQITCQRCGKVVNQTRHKQRFCSMSCAKKLENNHNWTGGRYVNHQGYMIFADGNGGQIREHTLIVEKALGKRLPTGVHIHHVDENKLNNRNDNLVVCQDLAYHRILHARMRIVKAGGNPNTDKICSSCKSLKSKQEFNRNRSNWDGFHDCCKICKMKSDSLYRATHNPQQDECFGNP